MLRAVTCTPGVPYVRASTACICKAGTVLPGSSLRTESVNARGHLSLQPRLHGGLEDEHSAGLGERQTSLRKAAQSHASLSTAAGTMSRAAG